MNLNDPSLWHHANETISAGYLDQPVVAIYVPDRDGNINPFVDMHIAGATVHHRSWESVASLEGMQQILEQTRIKDAENRMDAKTEEDLQGTIHDDYSLYVIDPAVHPSWYDQLGEVKELTGVLLTEHLDKYTPDQIQRLEARVGVESIYQSTGQACVGIERVLHRQVAQK